MAAKALLDHNPNPTLADVHHGLSGNFCRCGTYAGMRRAVLSAAPLMAGLAADEPEREDDGIKDAKAIENDPPAKAAKGRRQNKKNKKGRGRHG